MYLNLESDPASGQPLTGARRYRLVVPPIEARGFWSLSMYEKDGDGRLFFAANPIGRYSVGDRTPGLQRRPDGTIEILLQHEPPADRAQLAAHAGGDLGHHAARLPALRGDAAWRGAVAAPRA